MLSVDQVKDDALLDALESYRSELGVISQCSGLDPASMLDKAVPATDIEKVHSTASRSARIPYNIAGLLDASKVTNSCIYLPDCVLGWHTNSDDKGTRIYLTYSYGDTVFRYVENGVINDSYDYKDQWTIRRFDITSDPLWHCVATNDNRVVLGFRL